MNSPVSNLRRKNSNKNVKKRKGSATRTFAPRSEVISRCEIGKKSGNGDIGCWGMRKYSMRLDERDQMFLEFLREAFDQSDDGSRQTIFQVLHTMRGSPNMMKKIACDVSSQIPDEHWTTKKLALVAVETELAYGRRLPNSTAEEILIKIKWTFQSRTKEENISYNPTTMSYVTVPVGTPIPTVVEAMSLQYALLNDCKHTCPSSVIPLANQKMKSHQDNSNEQQSCRLQDVGRVLTGSNPSIHVTNHSTFEICHRHLANEDIAIISERTPLEELKLRNCGVDMFFLQELLNTTRKIRRANPIKIENLSVSATENIDKFVPIICKLMKECKTTGLNLEESNGTEGVVKCLSENIRKCKVRLQKLNLSYNKNLADFEELGKLVCTMIAELHLVNCDLKPCDLKDLTKLEHGKIEHLDVSYNDEIDEDSIRMLSTIFTKDRPVSIIMQDCDLTEDELAGFDEYDDVEIEMLDLSYNSSMESEGIGEAGKIARKHQTTYLRLSSCNVDGDCLDSLSENLEGHELKSLDLSNNAGICRHSQKIAKLLKFSNVERLNISNCRMTSFQIDRLADLIKDYNVNLKCIDLSDVDRRRIDQKYVCAIHKLAEFMKGDVVLMLPHVNGIEKKNLQNFIHCQKSRIVLEKS